MDNVPPTANGCRHLSHLRTRQYGVSQKMEVILTLSNRITLAGAVPLLVAAAVAIFVAALALVPTRPASAAADANTCKITPVILEMLLDRYGQKAADCDDLNLETGSAPTLAKPDEEDTWDLSGKNLTSFAITDDDAKYLKALIGGAAGTRTTEAEVHYIDLTDNPLSVDDVSFKNIPSDVAVKLTAESNVKGFQQADYTVTEGSASYISAAFPDMLTGSNTHIQFTVDLTGDVTDDVNSAIEGDASAAKIELVSFGTGDNNEDASKTFEADSDSESVIFYWPITVSNDNENDDDWEITLTINEDSGFLQAASAGGLASATAATVEFATDSAEVTVLDADKPAIEVCDRSEDVEEAILGVVEPDATVTRYGGTTGNPRDCDELTKRDLSKIVQLTVADDDEDDKEPLETLLAGDFSDLTALHRLHIVGARNLPSGIFAGVGKNAKLDANNDGTPDDDGSGGTTDTTVEITFEKNVPTDSDEDSVGDFTPSTIPQHIWADQEPGQVIILADDKGSNDKGVTKGLDADLYAGSENGHFFVLTNAATAKWVLKNTISFASGQTANPFTTPRIGTGSLGTGGADPIGDATADRANVVGGGQNSNTSRVVRFAVDIPNVDDEDKGDRNTWLFLFADGDDPTNAGALVDLARVAITDDD